MSPGNNLQGSILIVDDTPNNLRLLSSLLAHRGYKVRPAPSGAHALATTRKEKPDLILLDIMMPDIDGFEVCRVLKADKSTQDIPIIFLSALDDLENKIKGFEVGGIDYITKPFHEKEVIQRVETHLKLRNLQQDLRAETARFKTLTQATFETILIHVDGRVIDANPAASDLLQCDETQLLGANLSDLVGEEIFNNVSSFQNGSCEGVLTRFDGNSIPVEIRTKNLTVRKKLFSVTAIHDLTSQRQVELENKQLIQENKALKLHTQDRYKFGKFIGRSPKIQMVYELVSKASASTYPVVISGESGTGKELVARTIHDLCFQDSAPFISVNCGAVTESLFEREFFGHRKGAFTDAVHDGLGYLDAAHGGTLFLDEIAELPFPMQVKLLRVLERGEYIPVGDVLEKRADVRIVAATNKDLAMLVREGQFREDLFYRIQVIQISIPPLRERREDIRLLVEEILARHNRNEKIANLPPQLREMLYHYDWPGNVRELINTLQRYLATDFVTLPGSPETNFTKNSCVDVGLHEAVEALEKKMIQEALQKTKWHRSQSAEILRIPRRSLQRKIQKYGLKPSD